MNREDIIKKISDSKIIAIVRGYERDDVLKIAEALLNGGIKCMEITYNASKPDTYNSTADTISVLNEKFGKDMLIGAGTVLCEKQVELTHNAGGKFIISPNVNKGVIKKTVNTGMVSIPGALTPTECQDAHEAGADFVKLFPSVNMGSAYLKALSAPLSNIKFMAVGGITVENLGEYMKAGAVGIGTSSDLIIKDAVKNGEFEKITLRAKQYVNALK